MSEFKRAPRRPSSIIFNKALTVWIRRAGAPWKESAHAKKSKEHRCMAWCCRRATLDQEISAAVLGVENTGRRNGVAELMIERI